MKLALVTGASTGLGRSFARLLAAEGWGLVLVARDRARLEALAEELSRAGATAEVLVADLAELGADGGLARVEARLAREPHIERLVNNAGALTHGPFVEGDRDHEERVQRVLTTAVLRLTHAALGAMLPRGEGAILNVSSRAAFGANPHVPAYAAAKAWVNAFTLGVADQVEGSGVRLLALCPGNTATEIFERAGIDTQGLGAFADPDEVARAGLRALERGERVFVPEEPARDRFLRRLIPARVLRKLAGILRRLAGA